MACKRKRKLKIGKLSNKQLELHARIRRNKVLGVQSPSQCLLEPWPTDKTAAGCEDSGLRCCASRKLQVDVFFLPLVSDSVRCWLNGHGREHEGLEPVEVGYSSS